MKPSPPLGLSALSLAFAATAVLQLPIIGLRLALSGLPTTFSSYWVNVGTFLAFATAAALCFFGGRRQRVRWLRAQRGGCLACGYSLTGNVTGVCPECGTPAGQ